MVYEIFKKKLPNVEYLISHEGDAFSSTGVAESDLLSIIAVHPMRQDAVRQFIQRSGASWKLVEDLIHSGCLREVFYRGNHFYIRKFAGKAEVKSYENHPRN